MSRVNARILNKVLTTDVDFTLPPNEDYELFEGWDETDLAPGEIGINSFRSKAYMNTGAEIVTLSSDAIITLNGEDFINAESGEITDIELVDQDDTPIVPTSVVGNKITVTVGGAQTTIELMKSFQTASYVTSDDGDFQFGSVGLVDWFNLTNTNALGNTKRWTGVTGGYQDETDSLFYDKDGVLTTEALALPNNIVIDWLRHVNGEVIGYYRTILNYGDFDTSVPLVPSLTVGSYTSGWHAWNMEEFRNIMYRDASPAYNYPPFNFNTIKYFWTSTTHSDGTSAMIDQGNYFTISPYTKAVSLPILACRYFTVTGTVLT